MHHHTYTLSKSFQVIKFVDSFWQEPNAEAEIQNRQRCPARCKLCHALKNASRKTIESSSQIKVRASFEFLRILFPKFVLNLGRGWRQFNAHMLRFMCFVGFAWPECKTKRHFILCNVSFFCLGLKWNKEWQKGWRCVSQPAIKKYSCCANTAIQLSESGYLCLF